MNKHQKYHVKVGLTHLNENIASHKVIKVYVHEKYNKKTLINDIALLKLSKPLTFSNKIKAIRLVTKTFAVGKFAAITGWGRISEFGKYSNALMKALLPIIENKECIEMYKDTPVHVSEHDICAGYSKGIGACQGDSGGPLVINNELVGLVSRGLGCARAGYPTVFTNLENFKAWIKSKIDEED